MRRVFQHAWNFYKSKFPVVLFFSIPFLAAFLISFLVPAPSYLAAGSLFIRTGSIPEIGAIGIFITVLGYLLSILIVSYTLVNLNLLIKEKRTQTRTKTETLKAVTLYTLKIFSILLLVKLLILFLQLLTYGNSLQDIIYPILSGIISLAFFFILPAVVIDERDTIHSILTSIRLVIKKPLLVFAWIMTGFLAISISELVLFFLTGPIFGAYLTMLLNCLIIFPFLIILNSHIYMERYPLAR